jgi:septal ring factor EnvC (AmiA/AmiB activator)
MFFRGILATMVWLCLLLELHATEQNMSIEDVSQQLEKINAKIQRLNKENLKREGALGQIQLKLQKFDKLIDSISNNLNALTKRIEDNQSSLNQLEDKKDSLATSIQQHQTKLADLVRGLYESNQMVRLLGLAKPQSLNQYLINQTYFRYLQRARGKKISEIQRQQYQLHQTEKSFAIQLRKFEHLSTLARQKKQKLAEDKEDREIAAVKLINSLTSSKSELDNLNKNRQQLNDLIEKLRFVNIHPNNKQKKVHFSTLLGKLTWPVKGAILKTTSAPGVTIRAEEGLKVHAVGDGHVVFADWMRGFGLLIIIDHGEGFMSLYGNNQNLYKKLGEWAESGAVISTTGRSGGKRKSGLYFEIRKNAKPLDPRNWCKSS